MHVFRIFFVSTVLIPVLVIAVTSDESGLRIRRPRNIVISEDGTRAGRRHNPVNITDNDCPSLGCIGNLTTNSNNGKGSLAATMARREEGEDSLRDIERRFDSSSRETTSSFHQHHHPLKLEIKSIKNSTRSDLVNFDQDYIASLDGNDEIGTGRGVITTAVIVSWTIYYVFRVILSFILYNVFSYCWNFYSNKYGIGKDYVETYVKLGKDPKHPFGNYGGGWNPTFGISLKSTIVDDHHHGWLNPPGWKGWGEGWPSHGWSGWPSNGWSGWPHDNHHHASSYHDHHDLGLPSHGWHSNHKKAEDEEEDDLKHKFDREKGWKYAQKHTKKYAKKAHKYGLRPSKYSYMFDKNGNIVLGGKSEGYAWNRRRRSVGQ